MHRVSSSLCRTVVFCPAVQFQLRNIVQGKVPLTDSALCDMHGMCCMAIHALQMEVLVGWPTEVKHWDTKLDAMVHCFAEKSCTMQDPMILTHFQVQMRHRAVSKMHGPWSLASPATRGLWEYPPSWTVDDDLMLGRWTGDCSDGLDLLDGQINSGTSGTVVRSLQFRLGC